MELKFNNQMQTERVQQVFNRIMKSIQSNLSNGKRLTEIYIDKEIAGEVKDKIVEAIKGMNFEWLVVNRGVNQYTGKPVAYISMTVGDEKYYKLKYLGD